MSKDLTYYCQDKTRILNDLSNFQKLLEDIIELLLSKDNDDENENFLIFCENNIIEGIILITHFQEESINLIIIKIFAILIPSLKNDKIIFYLFSNNYMNQIILNIGYNKENNDVDYLSFYINFLKTVANRLDIDSFALFFNSSHNKFPLLDEIIIFLTYDDDVMIKNTSRNIFLSLLKLNYGPFIEYICDLPTITLFLLFAENLKKQIRDLCQKNENKINIINDYNNKISEIGEKEEMLIDDISFIQDILSINIPKINYLLINTIFYIPLSYLFNNIITRQNADISFYILRLFIENLENEAIKNIIIFIMYSSRIHIKIIDIVANEEAKDILKLLDQNKYIFHCNMKNNKKNNKLSFDDYIILNYSKKFLCSLRYIKETDNTYEELKYISKELNYNENTDNDIYLSINILNKKVDRINFVIKQIKNYHDFISKATGISCGASSKSECFLKIIYNNLISYKENNIYKNIYLQENIFKNECTYYINEFHLTQHLCTVNELFLINQIINDEKISETLKLSLNLLKDSSEANKKENNNNYIDINSIDDINDNTKITKKNSNSEEGVENFDTPPAAGEIDQKEENKNNINNNNSKNINNINFSVIQQNKKEIYEKVFGINYSDNKKNPFFSEIPILSLPNPVNNKVNISEFNNNINLIVDNKIMKYLDMNFDNSFFDRILINYKTNNEFKIVEYLINLLINGKRILNKLIYKLCIDIVEDLLINSVNFWSIKKKYQLKINEHYKQVLQMITDFLEKNSLSEQTEYNNYFFEFFEECFYLNSKNIKKDIKKDIFDAPILLTDLPKEDNTQYKIQYDLLKIPEEKYNIIKCLFQKFLSLYDLKYIINNFNDIKRENLIKFQKFPLYFFEEEEFKLYSKINLKKIQLDQYKLKLKKEKDEIYSEYIMFINNNYIFFCEPFIEDKEIKDENDGETITITGDGNINSNDEYCTIKLKIALRKIKIFYDFDKKDNKDKEKNNENNQEKEDKDKVLILSIKNSEEKIILLFDNILETVKHLEIINNNIKKAVEMEYDLLKKYMNKLLSDYSTINF